MSSKIAWVAYKGKPSIMPTAIKYVKKMSVADVVANSGTDSEITS